MDALFSFEDQLVPLLVNCPKCSTNLRIDKQFLGQPIRCKKCGAMMIVPAPVCLAVPIQKETSRQEQLIQPIRRSSGLRWGPTLLVLFFMTGLLGIVGVAGAVAAYHFWPAQQGLSRPVQAVVESKTTRPPTPIPEEKKPTKPGIPAQNPGHTPDLGHTLAIVPAGKVGPPTMAQEVFERLHEMIKPQPGEWQFAEINWAKSVEDARVQAAAEGKPIFIWNMAGEPLGQC
jgi:hypothetical protein